MSFDEIEGRNSKKLKLRFKENLMRFVMCIRNDGGRLCKIWGLILCKCFKSLVKWLMF